jgi:hypothetical protein
MTTGERRKRRDSKLSFISLFLGIAGVRVIILKKEYHAYRKGVCDVFTIR